MEKTRKSTSAKAAREKPVGVPSAPQERSGKEAQASARISRRAADRLRSGHVWVFASDIESAPEAEGAPWLAPVTDHRGQPLGTALYSPSSQIALRLVARSAVDETAWLELLDERLRASLARRKSLLNAENDACRLCFSEADQLPGLIVDKYGPLVIVQRLVRGLYAPGIEEIIVRVLRECLEPKIIVERPDARIRQLEGLPAAADAPLWAARGATARVQFHVNGLALQYDASAGQKTGAFLDQRMNYAAARDWAVQLQATGRALDVCTYQGGFALHLAQVCRTVTGIDASRASLEIAERNLEANRAQVKADVDWVEGDAFDILRDWSDAGERFDTIVLDPPAFAKSKRAVEGALRGYKELNLRALKMLRRAGLLVTCSCSHHVTLADLEGAVASAAADSARCVRLLERRGAAPDHPVILNIPETEYLKCVVFEVD